MSSPIPKIPTNSLELEHSFGKKSPSTSLSYLMKLEETGRSPQEGELSPDLLNFYNRVVKTPPISPIADKIEEVVSGAIPIPKKPS